MYGEEEVRFGIERSKGGNIASSQELSHDRLPIASATSRWTKITEAYTDKVQVRTKGPQHNLCLLYKHVPAKEKERQCHQQTHQPKPTR